MSLHFCLVDGLQQPDRAESRGVNNALGYVKTDPHMALRAEVIRLRRAERF